MLWEAKTQVGRASPQHLSQTKAPLSHCAAMLVREGALLAAQSPQGSKHSPPPPLHRALEWLRAQQGIGWR